MSHVLLPLFHTCAGAEIGQHFLRNCHRLDMNHRPHGYFGERSLSLQQMTLFLLLAPDRQFPIILYVVHSGNEYLVLAVSYNPSDTYCGRTQKYANLLMRVRSCELVQSVILSIAFVEFCTTIGKSTKSSSAYTPSLNPCLDSLSPHPPPSPLSLTQPGERRHFLKRLQIGLPNFGIIEQVLGYSLQ